MQVGIAHFTLLFVRLSFKATLRAFQLFVCEQRRTIENIMRSLVIAAGLNDFSVLVANI